MKRPGAQAPRPAPVPGVEVDRLEAIDPAGWRALVELLADLLDKPRTPEEVRKS